MTHNKALLDVLTSQRTTFFRFGMKLCRNEETSNDLIQAVAQRLLTYDVSFEVKDLRGFLFTMVRQALSNYHQREKRYNGFSDMNFPENQTESEITEQIMFHKYGCDYQADLFDSFSLRDIKKAAEKHLYRQQKSAVMSALAGDDIGEEGGENLTKTPRYQSLKTNRRLGTLKLKKVLG